MQRPWIRTLTLDSLILAGWLVCVGLALRHEQGQFWGGLVNPASSLGATMDAKEQWFGIYYRDQKVGFSHTMMIPDEREGRPGVAVSDWGKLVFNLLGTPQELEISAKAFIDADWRLQTFTARIRSATYELEWSGLRHGEHLLLSAQTPQRLVTARLRDPSGAAMVSGLSSWVAFHRLRVGQSGKAWVLNPLALKPETVHFKVARSDTVNGQETFVVETEVAGMTATSWVTPEGEVLRETSALGWELRRESIDQAIQRLTGTSPTLDLLSAVAVPVDRTLADPTGLQRLTLLVEGLRAEDIAVERPWQTVLPAERLSEFGRIPPEGPWCLVQLERPAAFPRAAEPLPEALDAYRRPSHFVQSADPRIIGAGRDIVGTRTERVEQVAALHQWVYETVEKQLTIGLPSAADVLATPRGDCHEHTVLFTALARGVGIPTRMVAGLVYQAGWMYYHAWPEVWVGRWTPIDPTLGQLLADATHLGLVEAEDEHLIALGKFVGRLRVSVLSVGSQEPAAVDPQTR